MVKIHTGGDSPRTHVVRRTGETPVPTVIVRMREEALHFYATYLSPFSGIFYFMKEGFSMRVTTIKLTAISMLCAVAVGLVVLIRVSIFPMVSFLEYDPGDIPILFGTLTFGPVAGLLMTLVVSVIQGVTVSASSGPIGIVMHILATGSMVVAIALVQRVLHGKKGSMYIAGIAGIVAMTAVMTLFNLFFTPIFMKVPRSVVINLLGYIIAFNVIKAGINTLVTLVLCNPLKKAIVRFAWK
jgi:riboflavin transporter FmnP